MKVLSLAVLFFLGVCTFAVLSTAFAQAVDAPLAIGSGSSVVDAPQAPDLHNPITHPAAALSDLQAAKKSGWALALFALLVMLTRAGVHLSAQYKSLAFLAKGRMHIVFAAIGALGVAGYNALALGGSLYAAVIAAGGALLYAILPTPQPIPSTTT
jgi:hypothetical protein